MENDRKLYIETYGCQMNVADSEVVAAIMGMEGYSICDNIDPPTPSCSTHARFAIMPNKRLSDACKLSGRSVATVNLMVATLS